MLIPFQTPRPSTVSALLGYTSPLFLTDIEKLESVEGSVSSQSYTCILGMTFLSD